MTVSPTWERYSRQILFAPMGVEGQQQLAQARVVIVGCGALGTAQADLLTRAGIGSLHLIDRDYVEFSNLQRQTLFAEEDARAGLPKAIAARQRLAQINSAVAIEATVADLTPANAAQLLDTGLILDGTDNFETRYLLNDFAVAHGRDWIYGAAVGSTGVTFTVRPGLTACLACVFSGPPASSMDTCDTAGVLAWVVQLIAAIQVGEAVKLLTGNEVQLRGTLFSADLWLNRFQELQPPARDPECRACARHDFSFLRGEGRPLVTLCGRNAVQIHEHHRPLDLEQLAGRLRPHGEVRNNAFALRFLPRPATGAPPATVAAEMTIFPDGRALIKGTPDAAAARSLYARYIGS